MLTDDDLDEIRHHATILGRFPNVPQPVTVSVRRLVGYVNLLVDEVERLRGAAAPVEESVEGESDG